VDTKKNTGYFTLLVLALVLTNCERNTLVLPDSNGNDPVFRLEMELDNTPIVVTAGENNIFNYTAYDADQDEVYTFNGSLSIAECGNTCAGSFNLKLRNYETGTGDFDVNTSLSTKSYNYKLESTPITDAIEVHMDISTDAIEPQFEWSLNDKTISQASLSDIHIINVLDENKTFAKLSVVDEVTGLSSFVRKKLELDDTVEGVSSRVELRQIEGDSVELTLMHSPSVDYAPVTFTLWSLEDLDGQNPQIRSESTDKISLRIGEGKSINNKTSFLPLNSNTGGSETVTGIEIKYDPVAGLVYHDASFDYAIEKRIAQGSDLALQTFEFEIIDENGTLFSSAKGEQMENTAFEILDIEPYIDNAEGQSTVKLTCSFSCRLYDGNGSFKEVNNGIATIAVAIP